MVKVIKEPFKAIKTTAKQKFITNLHNREAVVKLHMSLEISRCLGYGPKALMYKATRHRQKFNAFIPADTALNNSNNFVLASYLSGICLESCFSRSGEECRKQWRKEEDIEEKQWKMKRKKKTEDKESQMITISIFGFKLYFAQKHNLKKSPAVNKY